MRAALAENLAIKIKFTNSYLKVNQSAELLRLEALALGVIGGLNS